MSNIKFTAAALPLHKLFLESTAGAAERETSEKLRRTLSAKAAEMRAYGVRKGWND